MNYEYQLIENEVISREPDINIELEKDQYVLENTTRVWHIGGLYKFDGWHYVVVKKTDEETYLLQRV